ncbi:MAG TPA: hypothetical protein VFT31_00820 [Kribbella sp.]|nr:hypothetical protein [Kribbella sp.]
MQFAGGGVDDADVEVVGEQDDVGSGVGSADADVVEAAGVAQGDAAGLVDAVVPHPVVGVGSRELLSTALGWVSQARRTHQDPHITPPDVTTGVGP